MSYRSNGLLFLAFALACCDASERPKPEGPRLHVLRLSGSARLRGLTHGKALAAEIRRRVAEARPEDPGVAAFQIETCGERLLPHLPAEYREELQGIAEGAGVPLPDLLFLHTRGEIEAFREGPRPLGRAYAAEGVAGAEFDRRERDWALLLYEGEPPLLVVTLPGMAGGFLGARGRMVAAATAVETEVTPVLNGLTLPLLVRRLLEAPPEAGASLPGRPMLYASVALCAGGAGGATLQLGPTGGTLYRAVSGVAEAGAGEVTAEEGRVDLGAGAIRPAPARGGLLARLRVAPDAYEVAAGDDPPVRVPFR